MPEILTKIYVLKVPMKITLKICTKIDALKFPKNYPPHPYQNLCCKTPQILCLENPPKNFALKFPQKFLKNYA